MKQNTKPRAITRIGSMLIDYFVMSIVVMLFTLPVAVSNMPSAFEAGNQASPIDLYGEYAFIALIGISLFFSKDSINGRSPGKRALNLQVVDNKTDIAASPVKCFVRNVFCIIWPIEVVLTFISPSRRIGDMVAGTKVVKFDNDVIQPKVNFAQVAISMLLAYGLMLLITFMIRDL